MQQNLTEQLERLAKLHESGALSADEFQQAKDKILNSSTPESQTPTFSNKPPSSQQNSVFSKYMKPSLQDLADGSDNSDIGRAANRWVSLQTVMAVVSIIAFCIFGLFMCSKMNEQDERMKSFPKMPSFQE